MSHEASIIREPENLGTAVVVVHPDGDKILLGQRKNSYKEGMYGMPGGRLEFEESLPDAAARELDEETALRPNDLKYIGVVREQQETSTFIHFGFVTRQFEGEPITAEPEKCAGWEWHSLDALPEDILPGHKGLIDIFIAPEKGSFRDILLQKEL